MSLKILFIGNLNRYSESFSKSEAFKAIGCEVVAISSVPVPYLPGSDGKPSIWRRIINRLRRNHDLCGVNKKLKKIISDGSIVEFDILWSDKAISLKPRTLELVKNAYPHLKLVFASGDNMAVKAFRNSFFEQSISLFDLVMTMKSGTEEKLHLMGAKYVHYSPKSYDKSWLDLLQSREKLHDISFIGSFEIERAEAIYALAIEGLEVNVWGNGWENWANKHPKLIVHQHALYHQDMISKIEETRINLCFLRKLANDKSTNRTFEIPACAGFMMAEDSDEQRCFFPPETAAVYFKNHSELAEKVKYFLDNERERESIAAMGHQICVTSAFSYEDRCRDFVENIWPTVQN